MSCRLWDHGGFHGVRILIQSTRNPSIYCPGISLGCHSPLKRERCLLPCDGFLLSMHLLWRPSYYLIHLSHYNQVLTGVLPYHGRDVPDMIADIRAGKRPSRPIDSSQSRLLQDPVWKVITTGWHDQPNQRCELSVIYHTFSPSGQQEVPNFKPGDVNVQNDGNLMIAETS